MNASPKDQTCLATEAGVACVATPTALSPVPLCTRHRVEVALSVVPGVLRSALQADWQPRQVSAQDHLLIDQSRRAEANFAGHHPPRVYVISNGGRVKIGTTTNLGSRVGALAMQKDDVQLLLVGGRELESALHRYFADVRLGGTEWFEHAPAIDEFVDRKRRTTPVPSPKTTVTTSRNVPRSGAAIDLPAEDLLDVAHRLLGHNRAVLLSAILAELHSAGAPTAWTTVDLRAAYARIGVPVRRAVRAGGRVSPGIHRDDIRHV